MKRRDNVRTGPWKSSLALLLMLAVMLVMTVLTPDRAYAEEKYTQLTGDFAEVVKYIDDPVYSVYYKNENEYVEIGYQTKNNYYYVGPKDNITTSGAGYYYSGKSNQNYCYQNNSSAGVAYGSKDLYYAIADPDVGSQSITIKAEGLSDDQVITAKVVNPSSKKVVADNVTLNSENNWTAEVTGLGDGVEYTVEAGELSGYTTEVAKKENATEIPAGWTAKDKGAVEDGKIYAFVYDVKGTKYALAGDDTTLTGTALYGDAPDASLQDAARWIPSEASSSSGKKFLQNGKGYHLNYKSNGLDPVTPVLASSNPSYYYAWKIDTDGSIWMEYNGYQQLYTENGTDFSSKSNTFTEFTPYEYHDKSEVTVTTYTITATPAPAAKTLYVRLKGSFDSMIVGQESDADAVSGASTNAQYLGSEATAFVKYALVDAGVAKEDVPEKSWKQPDYFKNGNELQIDGTKSKVLISPEGSGMLPEFNTFSGGLVLTGIAAKAGNYKVSVQVTDTTGRTDTSNALEFNVYAGNETLTDQFTLTNCTQTQDGKYMYDMEPWYIKKIGGDNETFTVPKDVKAWYGSHGMTPTVNYGELGEIISLSNGEEPKQTLIIPEGCDLTMVNMRVHSGVKIIVQKGAKLTVRQTTLEGIVEVRDGGTFSMDYNGYGDNAGFLHGSLLNGQLQLKDGAIIENARIVSKTNYSARDDEDRKNYEPVVTVEGNVTVKGDVYILAGEAPTGETGQPALKVSGTLNIPKGSTVAVYGGGESNLTAVGGDAVILDNGQISGAGDLIAVGGFAMNTTDDKSKGSGGAAISGKGTISVARAYLEGGSSFDKPAEAIAEDIVIADTTNSKIVKGQEIQGTGNTTSPQYWHGTGDSNGTVPDVEKTIALVPDNAPAGVLPGKTSVSATVKWTDNGTHEDESVSVVLKNRSGEEKGKQSISSEDKWTKTIAENLDSADSYVIEASCDGAEKIEISKDAQDDTWAEGQQGNIEAGKTYLISYIDNGKTFILGVQNGQLGKAEWAGETPAQVPDGFKWVPAFANKTYGWYLTNLGNEGMYLSMQQNGLDCTPVVRSNPGEYDYYNALVVDDDGSIWSNNYNQNFFVKDGKLTGSGSEYTEFSFHKLSPSANEAFLISVTPKKAEETTDEGKVPVKWEEKASGGANDPSGDSASAPSEADQAAADDSEYTVTAEAIDTAAGTAALTNPKDVAKYNIPKTVVLADGKTYKVTTIGAGAFTGKQTKKVIVGANVQNIEQGAFAESGVTKLIVKTKKLTEASVAGSLTGSSVKVVKVKVDKKKVNKKFVKNYKKIFTAENAGRKVKVK